MESAARCNSRYRDGFSSLRFLCRGCSPRWCFSEGRPLMADPTGKLALGLLTGFLFGFLLQKGHVPKYHVIVRQFLLRELTRLKTMLKAVVGCWSGGCALTRV